MKRSVTGSLAAGALALLLAGSLGAALAPGAKAPAFKAKASLAGKGIHFSLEAALRHGPVVLYFYPSAFTKGCDLEAHGFADAKADFAAAGASVVGVSADSLGRLNAFSADPQYCAGAFPVASDPAGKIAAAFGLALIPGKDGQKDVRGVDIGHGFIPRSTFVIAPDGTIVAAFSSDADHLAPADHVSRSLEALRGLKAGAAK